MRVLGRLPNVVKGQGGAVERPYAAHLSVVCALGRNAVVVWALEAAFSGTGMSVGATSPAHAARTAAVINANSARSCCAHVARTLNSRSTNRQPSALREPKHRLRHSTAGRNARSAALLVGSTPSTRLNVHSASHWSSSSRLKLAILGYRLPDPTRSNSCITSRTGMSACCKATWSNHPSFAACQAKNSASVWLSICCAQPLSSL